jgi:hypothetical protein
MERGRPAPYIDLRIGGETPPLHGLPSRDSTALELPEGSATS